MKFIGVRDFRNKSAKVWEKLDKEKELVVTSNGRPIAILAAVSEENLEENLKVFRRTRAVSAVSELQRKSLERGTDKIILDQINEEIRAEREKRAQ
jgi:antitoxin (DNA-binding transcriptional repressor) of toxin-antitoxin stability system